MRVVLILAFLTIASVSASPSADRANLLDQLHTAKLAGTRARAVELEEELAQLRGETLSFVAQPADKGTVPSITDDPFEPVRYFSEDKPIVNIDEDQVHPSLAWDSDGTLWAAYEDLGHAQELHLCKSEDGGVTWLHMLGQSVVPPVNPALAIGEGDERWLLMVFEAADQYIWVYRLNLDTNDVDLALIADNELGVANPQIVTDSDEYLGWYAYVTFENRDYDGWNVVFSRSLNFGEDWVGMGYVGGQTTWDGYNGRDEQNRVIAPGLYFGRLVAQGREMSVRGLLLR